MGRQRMSINSQAADATAVLGALVHQARASYGWTLADLAARAGVSARTVSAVESGAAATSIGAAFNVAVAAGVLLFDLDPRELARAARHEADKVALLPKRVRPGKMPDVDLDF